MLSGFLEQAGKDNKKAFEAQKAVAIAQTIISTFQAATQAFAAMSVIPIIGPALGFAAAATIVAAGMSNVSRIRSQQYSGRQLGGPVMAGESYMVGENGPELFTPNNTGSITRNNELGGGGTTNVNFTIVANDAQGFDDLLLQRRGMITQMISDAQLERGMRA
jgi:SLT domain-containing protein